jgi:hypothetical protein
MSDPAPPPNPAPDPDPRPRWRRIGTRLSAGLAAVALLTAAAAKSTAPGPFLREVESLVDLGYGPTVALATLVLAAEYTLGVGLLAGWQMRSSAGSAAGLLTVFLGVLVWRLITEGPVSCTCFGDWWVRSPPVALATDVLLLAAALWPAIDNPPDADSVPPRWKTWAVTATIGIALPATFAQMLLTTPPERLQLGEDVRRLDLPGADELSVGEHLVVVINTECPRCRGQWPRVRDIAAAEGLPPLRGMSLNDVLATERFRAEFDVPFPMPEVFGLAADRFRAAHPPVLLYVRQGRVLAIWTDFLPAPDVVRDRIRSLSASDAGPGRGRPAGVVLASGGLPG